MFLILSFVFLCISIVNGLLDPIALIKSYNYPAELHHAITEDGYITVIHRIPHGINSTKIGPPVLIGHGTGSSSADFINAGPNRGLGYILADEGFDVWIGNSRGNSYSTKHVRLNCNKDVKAFYNFSFHEVGYYDYPAQIDYVLNATGESKLQFIGHSQGGTAYYVMGAARSEYNDKIKLALLLGAPAIMKHTPQKLFTIFADVIFDLEDLANLMGFYHMPFLEGQRKMVYNMCSLPLYHQICREFLQLFLGFEDDIQNDLSKNYKFFLSTPSDFAIKTLLHFGQIIKSETFRQYDYRLNGNMLQYGTPEPPIYNISLVTSPLALYCGKNDASLSLKDVEIMEKLLPNVVHKYIIPWDKFNHGDFVLATDVVSLLYNDMIRMMKMYNLK